MYDKILLPTDGGVASENATEQAVGLAAETGATLHALYVVDEDVYAAYSGDEYVDERESLEHALEEQGREALDRIAARAEEAGVEVLTALERGVPHEQVVEYADERDVDLIVMGTRERPESYRRALGSVTDRVLRTTVRPVHVAKTPAEDGE
jgi:nucleotide-binding universal stress UspA family protein